MFYRQHFDPSYPNQNARWGFSATVEGHTGHSHPNVCTGSPVKCVSGPGTCSPLQAAGSEVTWFILISKHLHFLLVTWYTVHWFNIYYFLKVKKKVLLLQVFSYEKTAIIHHMSNQP